MRFDGLDVVVTGGTGALGQAVVAQLLELGARVHVPWHVERELAHFAQRDAVALARVDLADESQVVAYYHALPGLWASMHLAGGFAMQPIVETTAAEFDRLLHMNTRTTFLCCREAVRTIRRAATRGAAGARPIGGRIVNVGARPTVRPVGGMVAYSVSKAGVTALTESLAEELKGERILVNAVLPSIMDTPANRAAMPDADHSAWPTVSEVAAMMVFLAAPLNAVTSGALVPVYGRA